MNIKFSTLYNKATGSFEGFVNFGNDSLAADAENTVATDILVFMLVGLRKSWEYAIGYVLTNKIAATNLNCLLSKALRLSCDHECLFCDNGWTTTNLSALKFCGPKLCYDGFTHSLCFIPDACHMI